MIHLKKEDETYKDNITLEHIYNFYLFDKELRNILIDMLESIEISFRTYIAYTLAIKHLIADKVVWNDFFIKLQALFYKYNTCINLEFLGFPKNWVSIPS
ncbi:hypothetical protein TPELB_15190 [Terrisporobacter petrolearius]|uniref:Uncharacterized protein n=1 Tax=Terrisporobacter petrolearius TaxID=1460447 RepID=A0ABZ3FBM3_9FIRM